jgi:hypothetical protein
MRYVAISIHGNYLNLSGSPANTLGGAVDALVGPLLRADGTGIGDPSIFERVERGGSQVALRQLDGSWLSLVGDRLARSDAENAEEVFTEVWWPDDRVSLRAGNGRFVCAENGGGRDVVVDRAEAGEWEKFSYEQVPAELVPADEPEHARVEGGVGKSVVDAVRQQAKESRIDLSEHHVEVPAEPGLSDTISGKRRPFP